MVVVDSSFVVCIFVVGLGLDKELNYASRWKLTRRFFDNGSTAAAMTTDGDRFRRGCRSCTVVSAVYDEKLCLMGIHTGQSMAVQAR
jgi:hypothetical protein